MLLIRPTTRKQAKIKLALQGCSGSGKTYSALLLAYGMTNDWRKIAVVDSENGSADLYSHLGNYNVVSLGSDYSPENYIEAISLCEQSGMEVIIVDSISHCWDYLLDFHANLQGNSFANWAKVTPCQNAFVQKILRSPSHIICTMRTKQDYVLNEKNGKMIPEKVGLKAMQRDGMDYEFTVVLDIDLKHHVQASKDRTGLFMGRPEFTITPKVGQAILNWCDLNPRQPTVQPQIPQTYGNDTPTATR
ncbi:MAG: ATP-binding protein [Alistipes sp.]|uniref:AAA family ATPase n=1 Tax=Alistipes sp. TaxID=1872444 RepID=UPI0025BAB75A|nr:AAA family ATPase [Alistipes sp.]MCD8274243.1 ATP-binding protein [Alistipes sp.]